MRNVEQLQRSHDINRRLVVGACGAALLGLSSGAVHADFSAPLPVGDWVSKTVKVNGLDIHYVEQGKGPMVLLCHGFPELWYSWRHQIPALARAGYRVIAPDLRGYGRTGGPPAVEAYAIRELVSDLVGMLDALGEKDCAIVGHDFGAVLTWNAALLAPQRFRAIVAMSVPYSQRGSTPPLVGIRRAIGSNFNYIIYFQQPGVAETELEADIAGFLRSFYFSASAEGVPELKRMPRRSSSAKLMDTIVNAGRLPSWLGVDEFGFYVTEYARNGLARPLNWYRNLDVNWSQMEEFDGAIIKHPTLFLAGELDPVLTNTRQNFERLRATVPGLRRTVLVPNAGHWVQQERPSEVNEAVIAFLKETLG